MDASKVVTATFVTAGGEPPAITQQPIGRTNVVGSTITFTQSLNSGPGVLFYDVGAAGPTDVTETEGTTPPLDIFRRAQIAGTITSADTAVPEPSTVGLMSMGLGALALIQRRRRNPL